MLRAHTDVFGRELVLHDVPEPHILMYFPHFRHHENGDDIGQVGSSEARIECVSFQGIVYFTPECFFVVSLAFLEPYRGSGASTYLKKSLLGLPPLHSSVPRPSYEFF